MPNTLSAKPYQILAHTDDILVIQTNTGIKLPTIALSEDQIANSFGKFNLGLHVNDDAVQVLHNRANLLCLINEYLLQCNKDACTVENIYWVNQIHSNKAIRIEQSKLALQPPSADALVSSKSNQALSIMTADCVPIVIYEPNSNQIAAIHAGWKGLANGVIFETYKALTTLDKLDSKSNNTTHSPPISTPISTPIPINKQSKPMQAWIGACISQSCYEVSNEVVDKLIEGCENFGFDSRAIKKEIVADHQDINKSWLDLPKLAQLQLDQLGIDVVKSMGPDSNSPALACSYTDNNYYSYRRKTHLSEENTGRMALLIVKLSD